MPCKLGGGHFEVATTSSTHRNVANVSSPIRQEDASGRHDVASGRQCIVMKLSAVVSELLAHRQMYVYGLPLDRQ